MNIVQAGDPVLRKAALPLDRAGILSADIQTLIRRMQKAMRDAPGVGLAAPQVGVSVQIAVIEDREEYLKDVSPIQLIEKERGPVPFHVIINPVLTSSPAEQVEFFEGCLSMPGYSALVARYRTVRVECLDERARPKVIEATGWYARILQHEIDHLQGTLYIDRMRSRTLTSMDNWNAFWKGKPIQEICSALGA